MLRKTCHKHVGRIFPTEARKKPEPRLYEPSSGVPEFMGVIIVERKELPKIFENLYPFQLLAI